MRHRTLRLLVLTAAAVVIGVAAAQAVRSPEPSPLADSPPATAVSPSYGPPSTAPAPTATASPTRAARLPMGGRRIFPGHFLVAYYGTAGTGSLGVLGEDTPERIAQRLRRAAAP